MKFAPIVLLFLKLARAVHHVEDSDDDDDDDDDTEEDEVGVRSGFDIFIRRLPGSLMLATSGNNTGTVMGTWSTNAIASTVFEFYQEETVIANGPDFGGWITGGQSYFMHVQQQMPFKAIEGSIYSSAPTGTNEAIKGRLDIDLLMTKLWTSVIVRDNIVTVFGFILNRPDNPLPADLYASLMILYNAIRLRRIHTLDVLTALKRMSFSPPQQQFIVLFEELHRHAPPYLKSTISVWVDALTEQRVNMNSIIRPGNGPMEVDFLASLEPTLLNDLEESISFNQETSQRASTSLKVLMGPLFSYVFAGLYDRSIELTQPLFALILLHLTLDQIVPQKDETERFVVDALRLNAIKHWDEVLDTLSDADLLDPFRLVTAVLQSIANNKHTDQQVRHDSLYILPHIKPSTSTYANENYAIMSEVVGSPIIKFKLLLDHITRLIYTQDMKNLKDRLLDYVLNGYIALDSALTGFIRYDYTTPYDVMIAILTRIQRRLPNLSSDMLGTVKALQVHLVFHKVLSQTKRHFPAHLIHFPSLIDAFSDPSLPGKVRRICKSLSGLLDEERIDWESLIGDMPVAFCTSPRQCFLAVLRKAIDKNVVADSRVVNLVEKIFNILDENGNVKDIPEPVKCEPIIPSVQTLSATTPAAQVITTASQFEPMVLFTHMPTIQTPSTTAPAMKVNKSESMMPTAQTPSTTAPAKQVHTSANKSESLMPTVQASSTNAPAAKVNKSESQMPTVETPSTTAPAAKVHTSTNKSESMMPIVQTPSTIQPIAQVNTSSSKSEPIIPTVKTPTTTAPLVQINISTSNAEAMLTSVQTSTTTPTIAQVNTGVSKSESMMPTVQTPINTAHVQVYTSASSYEPLMGTAQTPTTAETFAQENNGPTMSAVQMPRTTPEPLAQRIASASQSTPTMPAVQMPSATAPVLQVTTSASLSESTMRTVQTPTTVVRDAQVNMNASSFETMIPTVQMPTTVGSVAQVNTGERKYESIIPTIQTLDTGVQVNIAKASRELRIFPSAAPITMATVMTTKTLPTFLSHDFLNSTLPYNVSLLDVIPRAPQLQLVYEIIENNTIPELQQLTKYFRNETRAKALLILLESLLRSIPPGSHASLVSNVVDYINILVVKYGLSRIINLPKLYPLPPLGTVFPAINPSIFCLTSNFEQRESLLPYTTPFTPKDTLMKPIRDFITQPDLLKILGENFKPSEYPTKFLLLRVILQKAIAAHVVQEDFYLHDLLTKYLNYLIHQAEKAKPSVNWIVVLDALPHPKDEHEYEYFTILRDFIMSTDMKTYTQTFEVRRYPTRGQLLQNCLRHLLSIKQIQERAELIAAIKYFVDKVYLDGFGAKAVEYIIIKEQVIKRTIDLQRAFQAIALSKLDIKARKALRGVYKFFEKEFQPPIHLANYDLLKHKTKGEWLKAYFTYLADHPAVSSKARRNISAIIPYILLTGPGAENVD